VYQGSIGGPPLPTSTLFPCVLFQVHVLDQILLAIDEFYLDLGK
jgi:hypothetical protein